MSEDKQEGIIICPLNKDKVFPNCCNECIFAVKLLDSKAANVLNNGNERIGCAIRRNVRLLSERQKVSRKSLNKINNLKRRTMNGSG